MYTTGFVFHLCAFHLVGRFANYSRTSFFAGSSRDFASVAIMQSFLDPSLAGYYFDTPTNVIDYEIFGNTGLDHTTKIVLSFAHLL